MILPSAETALYNHPLPVIEAWLKSQGCQQDQDKLHCWHVRRPTWEAEISMGIEELRVRYINANGGNKDIYRAFPYSFSRRDVEDAIFTGP